MENLSGLKLAIWDLDGTIIDSFGVFSAVVKEAAMLAGREVPSEEHIVHNFHGTLDETIAAIFQLADNEADLQVLLNDFLRIQEDYYAHPDEHILEDSFNLAKRLASQNVAQIVVTNRAHENRGTASPRYLIENSCMKPFIADFVCGDDAPVRKPDAAVIADTPLAHGLKGDEIIVIGDQFVDAKLAQNLSARAVLVDRSSRGIPHLHELGEDVSFMKIVNSLDEVGV